MRHYREFEQMEIDGITYHVFRQDIGTLVLKKVEIEKKGKESQGVNK